MATDNVKGLPARRARPLLPAVVPARAAHVIVRDCAGVILEKAQAFERVGAPTTLEVASELREALASLAESARLWRSSDAQGSSVVAFVEAADLGCCAECGRPPSEARSRSWVSADWVATRGRVHVRTVTGMCRSGALVATRSSERGRPWLIEPEAAAEWLETRGVTG